MKYIGIDPDVDKSGFSVWDSEKHEFDIITTATFFDVFQEIEKLEDINLTVIVEAGWLNKKSNFHSRPGQSKAVGEKIAKAVGANHQVGKLFIEWCDYVEYDCIAVKPTKKKLNAGEFKRLTGYKKRTNSEMRDSAMLVFGM